jgi:putative phosphoserine phosphatase / 1-acylglycerol-3-phosphate O-acyltransferase
MTELALPAAIGEVEAGPKGPEVGAFFDLDGTLVEGFTARFFIEARLRNREIGAGELLRTARLGLDGLLGRAGFEDLIDASAQASRHRAEFELRDMAQRIFTEKTSPRIVSGVRQLVEAHRAQGHTVVMASSATNYQVEPVAHALDIDHVVCNHLVVDDDDGTLTGEVARPVIWGEGKALAIRDLSQRLGLELAASYFYADGAEDEALMHLVGHPRPVNPQAALAAVSKRRGWPIVRTPSSRPPGRAERMRNVLGVASLLPAGAAGLSAGLLRWNKRSGLNVATATWLDSLLRINGVKVRVVAGREHLTAPRPAVFVFNHRNNFDPFIVAALVRTNFTGVAKKELARDPIMGTVGRLADMVFIDRENPRVAVKQLKEMESVVRKGLSVLIAPEGARSPDGKLGPFKKGAFRVAMATGLPIIPIVVRNAEVIGARDATIMRPGTVEVAVLSPISVEGWATANLSARIEDVRSQFATTLRRWPG